MFKKKLTKRIAAILLALSLCMSLIPTAVWASPLIRIADEAIIETETEAEALLDQKVYCDATLEDDFADDEILVVINKERSLENRDFTVEDFPEIDCAEIEEIAKGVRELIMTLF